MRYSHHRDCGDTTAGRTLIDYAIGTVNFTGDMPIILKVDGPSLGGFVSLATIATSEIWKIGQAGVFLFARSPPKSHI